LVGRGFKRHPSLGDEARPEHLRAFRRPRSCLFPDMRAFVPAFAQQGGCVARNPLVEDQAHAAATFKRL
jgi:hypothetical protein